MNPRCPECDAISIKWGFKVTRKGRHRRYHCQSCGYTFKGEMIK